MSFLVVKIVLMKVEIVDEYDNYITVISSQFNPTEIHHNYAVNSL